jgi:hypothetical protein
MRGCRAARRSEVARGWGCGRSPRRPTRVAHPPIGLGARRSVEGASHNASSAVAPYVRADQGRGHVVAPRANRSYEGANVGPGLRDGGPSRARRDHLLACGIPMDEVTGGSSTEEPLLPGRDAAGSRAGCRWFPGGMSPLPGRDAPAPRAGCRWFPGGMSPLPGRDAAGSGRDVAAPRPGCTPSPAGMHPLPGWDAPAPRPGCTCSPAGMHPLPGRDAPAPRAGRTRSPAGMHPLPGSQVAGTVLTCGNSLGTIGFSPCRLDPPSLSSCSVRRPAPMDNTPAFIQRTHLVGKTCGQK